MAVNRIQFSDSSSGSSPYTLTINPVDVVIPHAWLEGIQHSKKPVDGASIIFEEYFDTRRGKLIWSRIPADSSTLGSNFSTQLSILEGYVGSEKYMHLKDISIPLGVFDSWDSSAKIKVIAVNKSLVPGGSLRYDKVEFVFEKAE